MVVSPVQKPELIKKEKCILEKILSNCGPYIFSLISWKRASVEEFPDFASV